MKTRTTILVLLSVILPGAALGQTRRGAPSVEPSAMTLSPLGARAHALPGPSNEPVYRSMLPEETSFVETASTECIRGLPATNPRLSYRLRDLSFAPANYNSNPVVFPTSATFPASTTTACSSPSSGCRYMQLAVEAPAAVNDTTTPYYMTIDFQAQVGMASYSGTTVGVAYALWVGEDRDLDGTYCETGTDECGYLDQTYAGPWLATTRSGDQLQTVKVSHTFRAQARRTVVRVYLYGLNGSPGAGQVSVNFGSMGALISRMNSVANLPQTACVVTPLLSDFSD